MQVSECGEYLAAGTAAALVCVWAVVDLPADARTRGGLMDSTDAHLDDLVGQVRFRVDYAGGHGGLRLASHHPAAKQFICQRAMG